MNEAMQPFADELQSLASKWMEGESLKSAMEKGVFGAQCTAASLVSILAQLLPLVGRCHVKIVAQAYELHEKGGAR